jgi:hypothetical protein
MTHDIGPRIMLGLPTHHPVMKFPGKAAEFVNANTRFENFGHGGPNGLPFRGF